MAIRFEDKFVKNFMDGNEYDSMLKRAKLAYSEVIDGVGEGREFLGWVDLPWNYDRKEYLRIKETAEKIRNDNDALVVIGVGGSYLGARALTEMLGKKGIEIIFAGKDLSSIEIDRVLQRIDGKDWSINVISKSGTTTEPAIALRILREKLIEKYGLIMANERIYATTDVKNGVLLNQAIKNNWERFVIPGNIGGRFSVLSAVGLLPIAAAGINIDELMTGAASEPNIDSIIKYATYRNVLYKKGFKVEVLSCFEPPFAGFNEWWKQLFGESEGKDGKGILPSSMIFTTDLHSLGQYVQDGERQLFETFVSFEKSPIEIKIPNGGNDDGLEYLNGKNLSLVNQKASKATMEAHHDGGVPVIEIILPDISPRSLGELIYFMKMTCAVSAYTLGVNPFDQPGVEKYKENMFSALGKSK